MQISSKPPRTRLQPEQRRSQLLECAIAACAEQGVARVTHAHLAERAGVSVSAVHSYFRTRDDLVVATLTAVETHLMALVDDAFAEQGPAVDMLTRLVARFDTEAREYPDIVKVWLDWSTGFRADVWPRYLLMQERLNAAVEAVFVRGKADGTFASGLDPKAATRLYIGGGITVALMRFAGAPQADVDILVDHLVRSVTSIGRA